MSMKHTLAHDMKSASYCCEASETISVSDIANQGMQRGSEAQIRSASYCCEASETIASDELPSAK